MPSNLDMHLLGRPVLAAAKPFDLPTRKALARYERCREIIRDELGLEPLPEAAWATLEGAGRRLVIVVGYDRREAFRQRRRVEQCARVERR